MKLPHHLLFCLLLMPSALFASSEHRTALSNLDKINLLIRSMSDTSSEAQAQVDRLLSGRIDLNTWGGKGIPPLHHAADKGSTSLARRLLRKGASPDFKDAKGRTPLYIASHRGHEGFVKTLLLTGKIDVNEAIEKSDGSYETSLQVAVRKNHDDVVYLLVDRGGARIDTVQSGTGRQALHIAAAHGHHKILRFLLSREADVNAVDKNNMTPLFLAARYNRLDCAKELIANSADHTLRGLYTSRDQSYEFTPYQMAEHLRYDVFKNTLSSLTTQREKQSISLIQATYEDNVDECSYILKNRTNFGPINPCFAIAVEKGNKALTSLFLSHGAGGNDYLSGQMQFALYSAAANGHAEVVEELLRAGAFADQEKGNPNDRSALKIAIKSNHLQVIEVLKEYNATLTRKMKCSSLRSSGEVREFIKKWWDERKSLERAPTKIPATMKDQIPVEESEVSTQGHQEKVGKSQGVKKCQDSKGKSIPRIRSWTRRDQRRARRGGSAGGSSLHARLSVTSSSSDSSS